MKTSGYLILGSFMALAAVTAASHSKYAAPASRPVAALATPPPYQLPSDNFPFGASQQAVDTFAWQEFIALNWAAAAYPGQPDTTQTMSTFGTPGDYGPGVWGTYKDANEVFGTTVPAPWRTGLKALQAKGVTKRFTMISKVDQRLNPTRSSGVRLSPGRLGKLAQARLDSAQEEINQAKGAWLTDQQGNLIWYEVRLNEDEFNYINTNKLYDSLTQVNFAQKGGIWLPNGQDKYGPSGAIEVKAAWRVIPTAQLAQCQQRYKIVKGLIPMNVVVTATKTTFSDYQPAYLGLVGLHIIHKTPNFPQFTWATFEHVDLAPTEGQSVDPATTYLLFNKSCAASCSTTSPASCKPNVSPVAGTSSVKTPVQVLRCANTIPNDAAVAGVNQTFQQKIKAANQASVFQYYRLVSTQWPQSPVADAAQATATPLPTGGITPTTLGNLASETYALQMGCMSCHQFGNSLAQKTKTTSYASDYSFLFGLAKPVLSLRSRPRLLGAPASRPVRRTAAH